MDSIKLTVINETGLHARPAATLAKCAAGFACNIEIAKASAPEAKKSAKSLMGIMMMGIKKGDEVWVYADGTDEEAALKAIEDLISSGCGE